MVDPSVDSPRTPSRVHQSERPSLVAIAEYTWSSGADMTTRCLMSGISYSS